MDREGVDYPENITPVSVTATRLSEFCFQWIPTYRVFGTGEQFWKILKLEDSTWKHSLSDEESDQKERTPIRSKL